MALKDNTRSQRITKHREELQREGFSRLDLFVPQEIKSLLADIGKANNLSASKTASLLLEHAAKQYELNNGANPFAGLAVSASSALSANASRSFSAQGANLVGAASSLPDLTLESQSVYAQAVAPSTLSTLKTQKETQLGKSWNIPKPNAVALGYVDSAPSVEKPVNPLETFFKKQKEKS